MHILGDLAYLRHRTEPTHAGFTPFRAEELIPKAHKPVANNHAVGGQGMMAKSRGGVTALEELIPRHTSYSPIAALSGSPDDRLGSICEVICVEATVVSASPRNPRNS